LQLLCFVVVFKKEWFGIAADNNALPAQISFVMVGIWWLGFTQIPLAILPNGTASTKNQSGNIISNGFAELKKVWVEIQHKKVLKTFLFSYFFYNMGVQTVMLVATLFGKKVLNIPTEGLIITILLIQIVAIPGAILIAKLSDKIGNIKTIISVIIFWLVVLAAAYKITTTIQFYVLGAFVGFVMGGIQSMSRSTYSKMIPANKDTTSYFSFFDVTEKFAIVIGLLSYGFIEELTGSMKNSLLAVMLFFVIGLVILIPIRNSKLNDAI
jgi:UMF1 family MFS transporter